MINAPVYPIPPAYADGQLNLPEISRYVKYLVDNGAKYLMTTAGTSQFTHLKPTEIVDLNEAVVEASGSAQTIVGDHYVDGADYLLLRYSTVTDRYTTQSVFHKHFTNAADNASCPVLIHWSPIRIGKPDKYTTPPVKVLAELRDHPNIQGIKEECGTMDDAFEISRLATNDFSVISAGGSMRRFCLTHPAGAQSYLAGIGSLWPRIEELAFIALVHQPTKAVKEWLDGWENSLFDRFHTGGWHPSLVFALDHLGLLRSCPRGPWPSLEELVQKRIVELLNDYKERL